MTIREADVFAYMIENEIVCSGCASHEEAHEAVENVDNLVLRDEIESSDDLSYCDRCHMRLS